MKTFPHHALSRGYLLGYPQKPILDSGVVAMQLGNGVLRTRDELGADVTARDLRYECLTAADITILENFRDDHRATTFYWADNKTYLTYECRFDPTAPPQVVPNAVTPNHYDYQARLLPVLPATTVAMLAGHWKMNDDAADTDVADASDNAYTLTAQQNTEDITTTGKIDDALTFNGSSDYLIRAAETYDHEEGTICAWIKPDSLHDGVVVASGDEAGSDYELRFALNASGQMQYYAKAGGTPDNLNTANSLVTAAAWNHVVLRCGAGSVTCFINGVERSLSVINTGSDAGKWFADIDNRDNVTVGVLKESSSQFFFDGAIDDVRIYRRPLTDLEIAAIYNSGSGTESAVVA